VFKLGALSMSQDFMTAVEEFRDNRIIMEEPEEVKEEEAKQAKSTAKKKQPIK
jgi:hypothetical protein